MMNLLKIKKDKSQIFMSVAATEKNLFSLRWFRSVYTFIVGRSYLIYLQ